MAWAGTAGHLRLLGMKRFLSAISISFALVFGSGLAATAHSDEVKTSPVAGSTVAGGLQNIRIEFAEPLLALGDGEGSEIIVKNSADELLTEVSCVSQETNSISLDAVFAESGDYKIVWRSVSEDGHPVSGNFEFTVDTSTINEGSVTPCETMMVIAPAPATDESEPDFGPILIAVAVWGALIVGLIITIGMVQRRRKKN